MKVTKRTKISKIIKENCNAIDAIASLSPHFKKLKNPFLRTILASRVTVGEAAKIGGVKASEILRKLQEIGFDVDFLIDNGTIINSNNEVETEKVTKSLDVRPIINSGVDPFKEIMQITQNLKAGDVLEIINSFEPIPLINILSEKGFKTRTIKQNNLFYTYFERAKETEDIEIINGIVENPFDETYKKYIGKMQHIDVRMLEMPEPMHTILNALETLPNHFCLVVEHKKIPQFLLPELEKRNFKILHNKKSDSHYQLLIFKLNE